MLRARYAGRTTRAGVLTTCRCLISRPRSRLEGATRVQDPDPAVSARQSHLVRREGIEPPTPLIKMRITSRVCQAAFLARRARAKIAELDAVEASTPVALVSVWAGMPLHRGAGRGPTVTRVSGKGLKSIPNGRSLSALGGSLAKRAELSQRGRCRSALLDHAGRRRHSGRRGEALSVPGRALRPPARYPRLVIVTGPVCPGHAGFGGAARESNPNPLIKRSQQGWPHRRFRAYSRASGC